MSFIPEKMNSIERALIAAASMAPHDARNVLRLICEGGMKTTVAFNEPSEGDKHYAKREKFIKRMKSSTDRVLNYAKHETLRKIEKHFRDNPTAIHSAESGDATSPDASSSLAARLTFDRDVFKQELLAALAEDQASALNTAGQQLFDEIGKDSVWRVPSKDAIQFIEDRANLLANVPDEVHAEIMQSVEQGLTGGESRRQLMARISTAFDEIGKGRAETIANTETAAAFNYARDKAMREAGITHKRWLHSQSPLIKEPRPTHLEADGQIQQIDDPFDVGGVQFMRPADDSLGAGPEDIINCHCVAIPVEAPIQSGDEVGHPFRGNQWTGGKPVHESVANLLDTLEKATNDPNTKRLGPGSRMLDLSALPISKTAAIELHKRGLAGVQTIKLPDKFGTGMQVTEKGKTLTHIFLRDKGRAELQKFRDFENYRKAIPLMKPTHEPVGFGDFVETPEGKRGIMRGGDPTLGGGHRVKVLDPLDFEGRKFDYATRSELKKLK